MILEFKVKVVTMACKLIEMGKVLWVSFILWCISYKVSLVKIRTWQNGLALFGKRLKLRKLRKIVTKNSNL